jgi:hypothetical protein
MDNNIESIEHSEYDELHGGWSLPKLSDLPEVPSWLSSNKRKLEEEKELLKEEKELIESALKNTKRITENLKILIEKLEKEKEKEKENKQRIKRLKKLLENKLLNIKIYELYQPNKNIAIELAKKELENKETIKNMLSTVNQITQLDSKRGNEAENVLKKYKYINNEGEMITNKTDEYEKDKDDISKKWDKEDDEAELEEILKMKMETEIKKEKMEGGAMNKTYMLNKRMYLSLLTN